MTDLAEEIAIEWDYINESLEIMREALDRDHKTYVELSAIATCIHHCYSGIEKILKRIFKQNFLLSQYVNTLLSY